MRIGIFRAAMVVAAGLWLAGCNVENNLSFNKAPGADSYAAVSADGGPPPPAGSDDGLLGSDPNDELNLGKKDFRVNNFGMAEKHFRRAVELHPRDAEAWLGLAASYDRLRRFDLADRAYAQAIAIVGPTVEILNNQGYSYMLRGDYRRARQKLAAAQRRDPGNAFVQSNLQLLDKSSREGKGIE
jgi:Flp pilus assembly protein TadD